jgi:hypothetical protein
MMHVFYSDVAYGCNGFQVCFRCVFQVFYKHVSSVSTTFTRMLQVLYLDVSKVDWVLDLLSPPSAALSLPEPATPRSGSSKSETPRALPLLSLGQREPHVQRETGAALQGACREERV